MTLEDDGVDTWDSGRRPGGASVEVPYEGRRLEPLTGYLWRVRVWDDEGAPSPWSDTACFEVGMGGTSAWTASWISWDEHVVAFEPATEAGPVDQVALGLTPVPHLRHGFDVAGGLRSARLYITARGLYEAHLNGVRVGDRVLAPGWTDYWRRLQYQAYDVTAMLTAGPNAIGVLLGDGWYSGYFGSDPKRSGAHYGAKPELLAQLHLHYRDGSSAWVVTDASWRSDWGAILHSDPLMGELQYPGLHPAGWTEAPFDDRRWHPVAARPLDGTPIVADPGPAVRVTQVLPPRSVDPLGDGTWLVDFGQNLTGWLRLSVDGPGGETIRVRHAEAVGADGRPYVDNLRSARQTDEFWTTGGREVFEPHFTWHGFRYAEVAGHPAPLTPGDVSALVVHSDVTAAGSFFCDDPVTERLDANIDWSLRGNFVGVPTDCPQRDERLGWLGDAQVFARTATYHRDVLAFFDKWLDDIVDAQHDSGAFSDIAPSLGIPWHGAPGWGDAGIIVPWTLYKVYGVLRPAARCYDAMTRWMEFLAAGNADHLRTRGLGNAYGDWLAPGGDDTPPELLATAYWAHDATLMARLADALGHAADARHYEHLASDITRAFGSAFVDPDGRVGSDTQTGYALALDMDLISPPLRTRAADRLVEALARRHWHLATGFLGVGSLLPALSANGHTDVAHLVFAQDTYPGWRYPVSQGATTMWERWDGWTEERGFQSPHMNSFNHYALGSVGDWLYRFVAGIDQPPGGVGFAHATVRPHPGGSLQWARATYVSVRGPISSHWHRQGGTLTLEVCVPPNVSATVHLPSTAPDRTLDQHGAGPDSVEGFCGGRDIRSAVFEVGPGSHRFTGPYPPPDPTAPTG